MLLNLFLLTSIFSYFIFPTLDYKDLQFYNNSQYKNILTISLGFYSALFILNIFDPNIKKNVNIRQISTYINNISLYTTFISFLTNNIKTLIIIRSVSWLFTFPYLLIIDNLYTKISKNKTQNIILLSELSFVLYILYNLFSYNIFMILCWIFSIIFLVYYNLNIHKYNYTIYISIIWLSYGIVCIFENINIISKNSLYYIFVCLDIISKYIFVYNYQVLMTNNLTNYYTITKVIRLFHNSLQDLVSNNLITDDEYNQLISHLDLSNYDLESMKTLLLDELFPNNSWKIMLSPFKHYKKYDKLYVMFCDMFGYSTFVKDNELEIVINYVDNFYTKIDMLVKKYNVNKVETIGDAYLIVSENLDNIVKCSIAIINLFNNSVRIGIDVGKAVSCTLGISKLRYAYIGNVVNCSARLESSGLPGKIHISEIVQSNIESNNLVIKPFKITKRLDEIELKGIGKYQTYFIEK